MKGSQRYYKNWTPPGMEPPPPKAQGLDSSFSLERLRIFSGLGFRMRILAQIYKEERWEVHTGFTWMNGVNAVRAFSQPTKVSIKFAVRALEF